MSVRARHLSFWLAFVLISGGLVLGFNLAPSADVLSAQDLTSKAEDCDTTCTQVRLQILDIDVTRQIATARAYITPPAKYASANSNSAVLSVPMYAELDVSKLESSDPLQPRLSWNAGDSIPAIDFQLDLSNEAWDSRSADHFFPFDHYSMEFNGLVSFQTAGAGTRTEDDDVWDSPPVRVTSYSSALPDLMLEFTYAYRDPTLSTSELAAMNAQFLRDLERGQFATSILVTRPPLTILIVLLLCLIFVSGGVSMLFLYHAILFRRRPATLAGLVWAASTAFTLIQTRGLLPSSPRSGILLDVWVFYPALALCFAFAVLMFIQWLRHDDWAI